MGAIRRLARKVARVCCCCCVSGQGVDAHDAERTSQASGSSVSVSLSQITDDDVSGNGILPLGPYNRTPTPYAVRSVTPGDGPGRSPLSVASPIPGPSNMLQFIDVRPVDMDQQSSRVPRPATAPIPQQPRLSLRQNQSATNQRVPRNQNRGRLMFTGIGQMDRDMLPPPQ